MNTDIQHFISKMSELEIVDSFNAIERHLLGEIKVIVFVFDIVIFSICVCHANVLSV